LVFISTKILKENGMAVTASDLANWIGFFGCCYMFIRAVISFIMNPPTLKDFEDDE